MIKNIIFDVGNVLVDFRWRAYMEDLGFSEETIEVLADCVVNCELWNELDRGVLPEAEVVDIMKKRTPGYDKEIDLFWERSFEIVSVYPYTDAWLSNLKGRGYRIYLLSNYPKRLFALHASTIFHFLQYTDGRIVSGEVKAVKPEPDIYRILFETYQLNPAECIFIDDRVDNIMAAKAQGMQGIIAKNYEQTREDLEKYLSGDEKR